MSAMLGLRIAGGGGFTAPVGTVRAIRAGKKPGQALVELAWGARHGRRPDAAGRNVLRVVGDARRLRRRWRALLAAGDTR